jgi:hypothetical protein
MGREKWYANGVRFFLEQETGHATALVVVAGLLSWTARGQSDSEQVFLRVLQFSAISVILPCSILICH